MVPLNTPFSLEVDVSGLCNLRCNYCFRYNSDHYRFPMELMSMETFKRIILQAKNFREKLKKLKLSVFGELFLHSDLPEMIEYIKNRI